MEELVYIGFHAVIPLWIGIIVGRYVLKILLILMPGIVLAEVIATRLQVPAHRISAVRTALESNVVDLMFWIGNTLPVPMIVFFVIGIAVGVYLSVTNKIRNQGIVLLPSK